MRASGPRARTSRVSLPDAARDGPRRHGRQEAEVERLRDRGELRRRVAAAAPARRRGRGRPRRRGWRAACRRRVGRRRSSAEARALRRTARRAAPSPSGRPATATPVPGEGERDAAARAACPPAVSFARHRPGERQVLGRDAPEREARDRRPRRAGGAARSAAGEASRSGGTPSEASKRSASSPPAVARPVTATACVGDRDLDRGPEPPDAGDRRRAASASVARPRGARERARERRRPVHRAGDPRRHPRAAPRARRGRAPPPGRSPRAAPSGARGAPPPGAASRSARSSGTSASARQLAAGDLREPRRHPQPLAGILGGDLEREAVERRPPRPRRG